MSKTFSALLVSVGVLVSSCLPVYADDTAATNYQRASCKTTGGSPKAVYQNLAGADGFAGTNQVVLASTTSGFSGQKAGYQVQTVPPPPPATSATGFRNVSIFLCQNQNTYGDAVLNGKVLFVFLKPDGNTISFTKKWSEMSPSEPDGRGFFSIQANSRDFGGFNVRECTLVKLVPYIDTDSLIGSSVYIGDYRVDYGFGGLYVSSFSKFPDAGCSAFNP